MSHLSSFKHWYTALLLAVCIPMVFAHDATHGTSTAAKKSKPQLGTSFVADSTGVFWMAYRKEGAQGDHVVLKRSNDQGRTWSAETVVNKMAERIAADGENRPKLAFAKGNMIVTWTQPTAGSYTGDVRVSVSRDKGQTFTAPRNVHLDAQLITHRFDSLIADSQGNVYVAWIDKRDAHSKNGKQGASIYMAKSTDGGLSFAPEQALANYTCECCRIGLASNTKATYAFWRHVFFEPGQLEAQERDFAFARLDQASPQTTRATEQRWKLQGCPHNGGSIAATEQALHGVWFNQVNGQGRTFYGRTDLNLDQSFAQVKQLPDEDAERPDVIAHDQHVWVVYKRFDGQQTQLKAIHSTDNGNTFSLAYVVATTTHDNDQPRAFLAGNNGSNMRAYVGWQTGTGPTVLPLSRPAAAASSVVPATYRFNPLDAAQAKQLIQTLSQATQPSLVVLWSADCTYCAHNLKHLAQASRATRSSKPSAAVTSVITIATDGVDQANQLSALLTQAQWPVSASSHYVFGDSPEQVIRHALDPSWRGEMPRMLLIKPAQPNPVQVIQGLLSARSFEQLLTQP